MEAFNLTEGPEMHVRTYDPEYRFTFKWTIENVSKIPIHTEEKSPEFSVDPQSKWHGEFTRSINTLFLYLIRNAEMSSVIDCSVSISDCNGKIFHKQQKQYTASKFGPNFKLIATIPDDALRPTDTYNQLLFTIFLKVRLPHKTIDMSNFLLSPSDLQQKQLETLSRDFKNLLDNTTDADVTLRVQGESIAAHKAILSARSSVFATMFQQGMDENEDNVVHIEDISMSTMKALISFMYSGLLVDYDFDTAMKLYLAANKYAVVNLRDICERILVSKLRLDMASEVLSSADMHRDLLLRDKTSSDVAPAVQTKRRKILKFVFATVYHFLVSGTGFMLKLIALFLIIVIYTRIDQNWDFLKVCFSPEANNFLKALFF